MEKDLGKLCREKVKDLKLKIQHYKQMKVKKIKTTTCCTRKQLKPKIQTKEKNINNNI